MYLFTSKAKAYVLATALAMLCFGSFRSVVQAEQINKLRRLKKKKKDIFASSKGMDGSGKKGGMKSKKKGTGKSSKGSMSMKKGSKSSKGSKSGGDNGMMCQGFKSYTVSTLTNYDKLILEGFDEAEVTWDVAFYSPETKIEFILPYGSSTEEALFDQLVAEIEVLETSTNATTVETQLNLPDLSSSCQGDELDSKAVHITLPRSAKSFCIEGVCRMVLCPLGSYGPTRANPNYVPGNTKLFFGDNINCEIETPLFWSDFVDFNFGNHSPFVTDEDWLRMDPDGDGAANIVEYYGGLVSIESLFADSMNKVEDSQTFHGNQSMPLQTDPNDPDTDDDLFTDAFEILYGMDPLMPNSVTLDTDQDGLVDFTEQIFKTNPFQADSDGDGVLDSTEVQQGTDPLDDSDFFGPTPNVTRRLEDDECEPKTVEITLSVGDPSGSHSERYTMQVGSVEHQATQFGVVRTLKYSFNPGTHVVTVRHRDSQLSTPDYDYTATIQWTPTSEFDISINDPDNLLGSWFVSSSDRTIGKVAFLTIVDLNKEVCNYGTCAECRADSECRWSVSSKSCVKDCRIETRGPRGNRRRYRPKPSDCPCEKCQAWALQERQELDWINDLPLCPCQAVITTEQRGRTPPRTWLDTDAPGEWSQDYSCNPNSDCGEYHPGAYGCLRAPATSGDTGIFGPGQQCCFSRSGALIETGLGAGTPDKVRGTNLGNVLPHHVEDVWTFENCCTDCEIPSVCANYIGATAEVGPPLPGARQDTRGCLPQ